MNLPRCAVICLANTHGLWRSLRLYRIGDGLEDREYFWLMNHLAAQAEKKGVLSKEILQRVKEANESVNRVVFGMTGLTNDLSRIDRIRRQIARIIVELNNALSL